MTGEVLAEGGLATAAKEGSSDLGYACTSCTCLNPDAERSGEAGGVSSMIVRFLRIGAGSLAPDGFGLAGLILSSSEELEDTEMVRPGCCSGVLTIRFQAA